jgi:hypothetical protein
MPPKHEVAGSSPARSTIWRRWGWSKHGLTYYDAATKTTYVSLRVIIAYWVLAGIRRDVSNVRRDVDGILAEMRAARLDLVDARETLRRVIDRATKDHTGA